MTLAIIGHSFIKRIPNYFVICIIVQNAEIYTNVGNVSTF